MRFDVLMSLAVSAQTASVNTAPRKSRSRPPTQPGLVDIAEKVSPAVVVITVVEKAIGYSIFGMRATLQIPVPGILAPLPSSVPGNAD